LPLERGLVEINFINRGIGCQRESNDLSIAEAFIALKNNAFDGNRPVGDKYRLGYDLA